MALGVSLLTFSAGTAIFSADVNSNFAQLNNAALLQGTASFATNTQYVQTNGGTVGASVDANGLIHFPTQTAQDGSADKFDYYSKFVGFNVGMYNHGYNSVNGAPNYFSPNVNSANNSGAMGVDTVTNTQVHINMPTAFSWFCCCSHMF